MLKAACHALMRPIAELSSSYVWTVRILSLHVSGMKDIANGRSAATTSPMTNFGGLEPEKADITKTTERAARLAAQRKTAERDSPYSAC
jgi:hypothetical protein